VFLGPGLDSVSNTVKTDLRLTDLIDCIGVRHVCDVDGFGSSLTDADDVEVDKVQTELQFWT